MPGRPNWHVSSKQQAANKFFKKTVSGLLLGKGPEAVKRESGRLIQQGMEIPRLEGRGARPMIKSGEFLKKNACLGCCLDWFWLLGLPASLGGTKYK